MSSALPHAGQIRFHPVRPLVLRQVPDMPRQQYWSCFARLTLTGSVKQAEIKRIVGFDLEWARSRSVINFLTAARRSSAAQRHLLTAPPQHRAQDIAFAHVVFGFCSFLPMTERAPAKGAL